MIQPNTGQSVNPTQESPIIDANVVVLNNYFRQHHTVVFREVSKRIRKLKVLLSTPMEPDRQWQAEWDQLDVSIQKNWTWTTTWRHSTGIAAKNFIHFPIDTVKQLRTIQPDIVFSYELGARTLLSSRYCRKHGIPLVMVGNMSEWIERERGILRRRLRKFLLNKIDYCTYNGPSCKRYLQGLGVPEERLLHFPYAYDRQKTYHGPEKVSEDGIIRLMFCGVLDPRKGFSLLLKQLTRWAKENSGRKVELSVCGSGENEELHVQEEIANLEIRLMGHCDNQQLAEVYGLADICVFPSLADEWGLVTVEALASGTPVVGSLYAQSVESLIRDGINGWSFRPDYPDEFYSVLDKALNTDVTTLVGMANSCRESVRHISASRSADYFSDAVRIAMSKSGRKN